MKILKSALLFIILSFHQISIASDAGGPPSVSDLIGFWKMVKWPNPEKNLVNPWPLPYQWFAFYEDGRFLSMMKKENNNYSKSELKEIFSALQVFDSPKYQLKGQFLIVNNPSIKNYKEIWGVNIFSKDIGPVAKKGDLIMSLAGRKNGAPVYYRLLRKVH